MKTDEAPQWPNTLAWPLKVSQIKIFRKSMMKTTMYVQIQYTYVCWSTNSTYMLYRCMYIYIYIVSHVYSIFYIHTSYFWSTYVHIYIHIHIHVLDKCLGGHDGHVYRYAYPSFILFPQHCQDTQRAGRYDPICPVPNGCEPLTFCSSTVKRPEAL